MSFSPYLALSPPLSTHLTIHYPSPTLTYHRLGIELSSPLCAGPLYRLLETSHVYQSMTALNLSNNKLTYIPTTLQYLPGLKRLNVSGNLLGIKSSQRGNQRSKDGSERGMGMGMGMGRGSTSLSSNQMNNNDQNQNRQSSTPIAEMFPPTLTALDISHNQLDSLEFTQIIRSLLLLQHNHNHIPPVKASHPTYLPISHGGGGEISGGGGGTSGGAGPPGRGGRVAATPTSSQVIYNTHDI